MIYSLGMVSEAKVGTFPNRTLIWRRIEARQERGLPLTADETKAAQIREVIVDVAIAAAYLLENPKVEENSELREELIDECREEQAILREDLGFFERIGKDPDSIDSPLELARYAASLMVDEDFNNAPRQGDVFIQCIEGTTDTLQDMGIHEVVARAQTYTPTVKKLVMMDRRVKLVSALLSFQ